MKTPPLLERLRTLDPNVLRRGTTVSQEELRELERAIGKRLPDDYRACLLEFGTCEIRGPKIRLSLYGISDVLLSLDDETINEDMQGIVVIGADAGGFAYYYDPRDMLGKGAFALFIVGYGTLTFEKSMFVAPTLTQAIDELLAGEDFRMREPLGKKARKKKRKT